MNKSRYESFDTIRPALDCVQERGAGEGLSWKAQTSTNKEPKKYRTVCTFFFIHIVILINFNQREQISKLKTQINKCA